jgi:hypothetical protein
MVEIIVSNQQEAIEIARLLQQGANNVSQNMMISEIEQTSLVIQLCALRDSIVIVNSKKDSI